MNVEILLLKVELKQKVKFSKVALSYWVCPEFYLFQTVLK